MRRIIRIISLFVLIVSFSCEKQGLIVNCSDCKADEPTKADLVVKVDLNLPRTAIVLINVYEGNLEDSVLYTSLNASSANITIPVTISKKYTVTATYNIGGNCYIAVDSATPGVKYEKNQCNNPCFYIYDKNIDLRLRQR
jgi:hypothetical protein